MNFLPSGLVQTRLAREISFWLLLVVVLLAGFSSKMFYKQVTCGAPNCNFVMGMLFFMFKDYLNHSVWTLVPIMNNILLFLASSNSVHLCLRTWPRYYSGNDLCTMNRVERNSLVQVECCTKELMPSVW